MPYVAKGITGPEQGRQAKALVKGGQASDRSKAAVPNEPQLNGAPLATAGRLAIADAILFDQHGAVIGPSEKIRLHWSD